MGTQRALPCCFTYNRIWLVSAMEHQPRAQPATELAGILAIQWKVLYTFKFGIWGWSGVAGEARETGIWISKSICPSSLSNTQFTTLNKPNISFSLPTPLMNGCYKKKSHLQSLLIKGAEKNMNSHSHTPVPHSFQRLTSQVFLLFGFSVSKPKRALWQWRKAVDLC